MRMMKAVCQKCMEESIGTRRLEKERLLQGFGRLWNKGKVYCPANEYRNPFRESPTLFVGEVPENCLYLMEQGIANTMGTLK